MPKNDVLTPQEASRVAINSYFTLKDWVKKEPTAGVESSNIISNQVLGDASAGKSYHDVTSTLKGTKLESSNLTNVHSAQTGFGVTSGFGYTAAYEGNDRKHVIIATRGTRPEMSGAPDIITDINGVGTSFGDCGMVHSGFKRTFDSILPNILRDSSLIHNADVIHCVGHSLGGAVATLIAAHFGKAHNNVKLYTFGSPRVGWFSSYSAIEDAIKPENIYRVAHDLDPVTLLAPFPYVHVLPSRGDNNNMTLPSPNFLGMANHDMAAYIAAVGHLNWDGVRRKKTQIDFEGALLSRVLLRGNENPGWVARASVNTLSLLFKLFSHALKAISTSLILGLTAVDLLAEIIYKGLHKLKQIGEELWQLLKYAAIWAGIKAVEIADFTAGIIRQLLKKMLATLQMLATTAVDAVTRNINPVAIGITGGLMLTAASAF